MTRPIARLAPLVLLVSLGVAGCGNSPDASLGGPTSSEPGGLIAVSPEPTESASSKPSGPNPAVANATGPDGEEVAYGPTSVSVGEPGVDGTIDEVVSEEVVESTIVSETFEPYFVPPTGEAPEVKRVEVPVEQEHPYVNENAPAKGTHPPVPRFAEFTFNQAASAFNGDTSYFEYDTTMSWQDAATYALAEMEADGWMLRAAAPDQANDTGLRYSFSFERGKLAALGSVIEAADGSVLVSLATEPAVS